MYKRKLAIAVFDYCIDSMQYCLLFHVCQRKTGDEEEEEESLVPIIAMMKSRQFTTWWKTPICVLCWALLGTQHLISLGLYCLRQRDSSLAEPGAELNKAGHWLGLPID